MINDDLKQNKTFLALNFKLWGHLIDDYRTPPFKLVLSVRKMLKKFAPRFNHFISVLHPENGAEFKINAFWLRDHCRCKECYNEKTHQITSNVLKIPPNVEPIKIEQTQGALNILWSDDHKSEYSISHLYNAVFPQEKHKPIFWNKKILQQRISSAVLPQQAFDDGEGCKNLLKNIITLGVGVVSDVEPTFEGSEKFVNRIAPTMDSIFGRVSLISNDTPYHEDFAYTNVALEAHNDNTYWNDAAGLEAFHILKHDGEGGETLLVDGFNAASKLKEKEPEAFKVLCEVPISSEFIEKNCHYWATDSVLRANPVNEKLIQIRFNVRDRAIFNTIPQSDVGRFYEAYRLLGEEINKEENQFWVKLQPGTVLIIDNWRILHGRSAFTGVRRFFSCYISRRDWTMKAKVLGLL